MKTVVSSRVNHHAQIPVIVIPESNKAKWLQNTVSCAHSVQHLCHATHRAGLRLKSDLNKISLLESLC